MPKKEDAKKGMGRKRRLGSPNCQKVPGREKGGRLRGNIRERGKRNVEEARALHAADGERKQDCKKKTRGDLREEKGCRSRGKEKKGGLRTFLLGPE